MLIPALTAALRSLQSVIYIQTHDILSWLDAIQDLLVKTAPRHRYAPNLFFLKPGVELREPKEWMGLGPAPEPSPDQPLPSARPFPTVEFTEEQVIRGFKSLRAYDVRDSSPYFVIPNVVLTPAMLAEFRLQRLQQEMDDHNVKGVIVLSHEPPPADFRPFCQFLADPGPTEEETTKFLISQLARLRREDVPVEGMAKAAEGHSFFQISEAVTRAVVETRKLDGEARQTALPEAFAKTMAETPKVYPIPYF